MAGFIVGALVLAAGCLVAAAWVGLAAIFAMPQPEMFGVTQAYSRLTPGTVAALEAKERSLRATSTALFYSSIALLLVSVVAIAWCAWQTRREFRHWHFPSFFGLACLAFIPGVGSAAGSPRSGVLAIVALDLVAIGASLFDLTRQRYGAPGRVVAWATAVLALGTGAVLSLAPGMHR